MFIFIILLVSCQTLDSPSNGTVSCSLGDDGVPSYEDSCSFTCDIGYVLTGSDTRTCQSNGSWSGSDVVCSRGEYMASYVYTNDQFLIVRFTIVSCARPRRS